MNYSDLGEMTKETINSYKTAYGEEKRQERIQRQMIALCFILALICLGLWFASHLIGQMVTPIPAR